MVEKKSFLEDAPLLLSVFFREIMAVALLLLLESRVSGYDLMNKSLILFLILITVRLPYINSYAYIFESASLYKYTSHSRHGSRSDAQNSYWFPSVYFIIVLFAHVLGSIVAAWVRVYWDVQYGTEIQLVSGPVLKFGIKTDVSTLGKYESDFFPDERYRCFAAKGVNSTQTVWFPLLHLDNYCITDTSIQAWYIGEEAAYVFLLCVCLMHSWLATSAIKEGKSSGSNPFAKEYWNKLFRLSVLLTSINLALARAFPTAHGSLHNTLYMFYYQKWTPGSEQLDDKHGEFFFRVLGGLLGALLGMAYNSMTVATQDPNGDPGYFKLVWGFARESSQQTSSSKEVYAPSSFDTVSKSATSSSTVYVIHGGQTTTGSEHPRTASGDFKLRIPYSLS
jgi:hypothetical protein